MKQLTFDIELDEAAAEIIRLIFYKYVHEGYEAQRLCKYLAEMHIYKEDGKGFPNTTINRIIKNEIYTGVMHNGGARSEIIPELQIITVEKDTGVVTECFVFDAVSGEQLSAGGVVSQMEPAGLPADAD